MTMSQFVVLNELRSIKRMCGNYCRMRIYMYSKCIDYIVPKGGEPFHTHSIFMYSKRLKRFSFISTNNAFTHLFIYY